MRISYEDLQDRDTALNLDRRNTNRLLDEHGTDIHDADFIAELGTHDRYNSADVMAFLGY